MQDSWLNNPRYDRCELEKSGKLKIDLLWWQERGLSYTSSGYGKKIPTCYKAFVNGKWRRVYCTIYSNSGTCWIIVNGKRCIVG